MARPPLARARSSAGRPRQIVAMGGGGFSEEESPALDDYILDASGRPRPRVCFLPTAGGDNNSYLVKF